MRLHRVLTVIAGFALGMSLCLGTVSAQTESATAEDGAPVEESSTETTETTSAPDVPLGANLTPPVGALPPGPAIIHAPGSGLPGSSSVSMAPGTQTTGVAIAGPNAVVEPEAAPAPPPEAAPAPVAETTETAPADTAPADTAVATETDLDADNYADALELELGLDPNNADTDADGTADGDELNIYGTDPFVFDTDGDGIGDGEELFGILTDPLVWGDFSVATSEAVAAQEATGAA